MSGSYWEGITQSRISRRRALAATGVTAAAAAFLAACGGDDGGDGGGGGTGEKSTLAVKTEDSIKEAKRGGIIKDRTNADTSSMDVQQPLAPLNTPAKHVYSTLLRLKAPYLQADTTFDLVGDLAQSWEVAPDGLTITLKLRQGAKWHNKPPVNGRAVDSSDVVFSWNRYAATAPLRGLAANSANPQAPVLSLTATDPQTISVKLKEPLVYALELFGSFGSFTGNITQLPKEAENNVFDLRRDMIGTGPYVLTEYQPSIGFTLKRNPDYWDQNANFADQINQPIILEPAQFLAQIKAGNIYHSADQLRGEDLFATKSDAPDLIIYALDLQTASSVMTFGQLPEGKSPFTDERVRQAFSMAYDRQGWTDAMFNVSALEAGGVAVESRWNSALPADFGDPAGWLDPQGKDFGPNAKYYEHNIEEAKKLLTAAGFAGGLDVKSNRITTGAIPDMSRHSEAIEGMVGDAGFRIKVNNIDYATQYIPQIRDAQGQYEGIGFHTVTGTTPWRMSPVSALASEYWSKAGATFKGFSKSGRNDKSGDPEVDALIEKARLEKDAARRKALVQDIQRLLGKSIYGLINPGTANKFSVAWPALRNYQVYRHIGASPWTHYGVWLDTTKKPFV
jgi:peptide/nickel transport system substrate-binding protein